MNNRILPILSLTALVAGLSACGEDAAMSVESAGFSGRTGQSAEFDSRTMGQASQTVDDSVNNTLDSPLNSPTSSPLDAPSDATTASEDETNTEIPVDPEEPSFADNDPTPDPLPSEAPIESVGDVLARCDGANVSTRTVQVIFEEQTETCAWGVQGNRSTRDGVVRARAEKFVDLPLNQNELICSVGLSSTTQQITFDDELFLTFNGIVLLSSYDYNDRFPSYENNENVTSYLFDWDRLIGGFNPGPNSPAQEYCLGSGEPGAFCSIPKTQSVGSFALALSDRDSALLGYSAKKNQEAKVGLVVTGDNDSSTDCKHSRMVIDVTISSVPTR